MKTSNKLFYCLTLFLLIGSGTQAQFLKKLAKKAEDAAQRTVERRVENETSKKTDQALDSILEPGSGEKKAPTTSGGGGQVENPETPVETKDAPITTGSKSMTVYSKFDYVPGDKTIFFDDYAHDFIGDFPSKWNTNGSGEVVTVNDSPQRWLELIPGYGIYFIPNVPDLPEEYTIEFDMLTYGLDDQTSSTANLKIMLSDDKTFNEGDHHVEVYIPVGQYAAFSISMRNYLRAEGSPINSEVRADIRKAVLNQPHISIAVNKSRFRLWVNEEKYVDIPKLVPENKISTLKFNSNGLQDGKEKIFISNLKVAEGGVDLRRKLLEEGKVSTNGILFNSGSANIQPQSMGIIRQISQVLQQDASIKLKIVGHTDSDGSDVNNLKLSKDRAEAVKNSLVTVYGVAADRLVSEGKGEGEPVGDNNTPEGKSQNRRVEFIKL